MHEYTLAELFCLTRAELFALHSRIVTAVNGDNLEVADHDTALRNLRKIRRVLAHRRVWAP